MIHGTPQIFDDLKCIFIHVPKSAGTSIEKTLGGTHYGGHSFGQTIKRDYPQKWKEYYKFGIVRDPLTRFGSAYYYIKQKGFNKVFNNKNIIISKDINDYIHNYFLNDNILHMWKQTDFVCDKEGPIVDIYKYEELEQGWKEIQTKLGIEYKPLPIMNKSKDYKLTYDIKSQQMLRDYYKWDFNLWY